MMQMPSTFSVALALSPSVATARRLIMPGSVPVALPVVGYSWFIFGCGYLCYWPCKLPTLVRPYYVGRARLCVSGLYVSSRDQSLITLCQFSHAFFRIGGRTGAIFYIVFYRGPWFGWNLAVWGRILDPVSQRRPSRSTENNRSDCGLFTMLCQQCPLRHLNQYLPLRRGRH